MADYDCCMRFAPQLRHIHFHTDSKHEQTDPNLTKESQRAQGRRSKNKLKRSGRQETEDRRTQKNASHHLPYHSRLAKMRKDPANQIRNGDHNEELQNEPT